MTYLRNPRDLLAMCRQLRTLFYACENTLSQETNAPVPPFDAIRDEWLTLWNSAEEFPFNNQAIQIVWNFVVSMTDAERIERLEHYDSEERRLLKEIEQNGGSPQVGAKSFYG
jgi:hypothetical protein